MAERSLPTGVVTFCITDIERSTRLLTSVGPTAYEKLLETHRGLLRAAWARYGGVEVNSEGDGSLVAFGSAADAVAAAVEAQVALQRHDWRPSTPVRVRIGLHTGDALVSGDDDYIGFSLHQAARVSAAANGGQILVSEATASAASPLPEYVELVDVGSFSLKDIEGSVRLYSVRHPDLTFDSRPPRAPASAVRNLPIMRNAFVGRRDELTELRKLATEEPLVTVLGPGGAGKTRLAIECASRLTGDFDDGVWLVELADVPPGATDDVVLDRIRESLAVPADAGVDPADAIVAHLRAQRTLLVVDNCEHVIGPVARFVDTALAACEHVAILATSREPLRVRGERTWKISSLRAPESDDVVLDDLVTYDAVALFVDRATAVDPSFEANATTASAIANVCRRLDGIPLALELAAAFLRSGTVAELVANLDDRLTTLVSGYRTDLPRQQTLEATIAWSYDLLAADEQALFRRLSVFQGGADSAAVDAVCGDGSSTRLASLLDRSLVVQDSERWRMLESIHEFAAARLADSGETEVMRAAHRSYFAERARGGDSAHAELIRELPNLRAALAAARDEQTLELANALTFIWFKRGLVAEGRRCLDAALAAAPPSDARAAGLRNFAWLSLAVGDFAAAERCVLEAVEWYRSRGKGLSVIESLLDYSEALFARGDFDQALRHATEGRELARARDEHVLVGKAEYVLAECHLVAAHYEQAASHAAAALQLLSVYASRWVRADALVLVAQIDAARGLYASAVDALREAREIHLAEDDSLSLAYALWHLGTVEHARGDLDAAVLTLREAAELLERAADVEAPLAYGALAEVLSNLGDVDAAEDALARGVGLPQYQSASDGPILIARASIKRARGDAAGAVVDARAAALELYARRSISEMLRACDALAEALTHLGHDATTLASAAAAVVAAPIGSGSERVDELAALVESVTVPAP
ncbi:MAG: hypothetical protein QOK28_3225 [Actinomycetota bacterium]